MHASRACTAYARMVQNVVKFMSSAFSSRLSFVLHAHFNSTENPKYT